MQYKVIGLYKDGVEQTLLTTYPSLQQARDAILWQAQPREEITWNNKEKTTATVQNTGGRFPYTVIWRIEEIQG